MKFGFVTLFFFLCSLYYAQTFEFCAGYNLNRYFDHFKDGHLTKEFTPGNGYQFGIGIRDFLKDTTIHLDPHFSLVFSKITGQVYMNESYHVATTTYDFISEEYLLSLNFTLQSFKIGRSFFISPGISVFQLLGHEIEGYYYHWGVNASQTGTTSSTVSMTRDEYRPNSTGIGFFLNLENEFTLNDQLSLSPRLIYYYGLSDKFQFYSGIKSMQVQATVALYYSLK